MNIPVKTTSDSYEVIYSAYIKPFKKESNTFKIILGDLLEYQFEFIDEKDAKSSKTKSHLKAKNVKNKTVKFTFYNYLSSFATTNTEPIKLGYIKNHDIYMNYTVFNTNGYKDVLIVIYRDPNPRNQTVDDNHE